MVGKGYVQNFTKLNTLSRGLLQDVALLKQHYQPGDCCFTASWLLVLCCQISKLFGSDYGLDC